MRASKYVPLAAFRTDSAAALILRFLLIFATSLLISCHEKEAPLPQYGQVRNFSLTTEDGTLLDTAALDRTILVVNFFFATCPKVCPAVQGRLAQVVHKYRSVPQVQFLSISIDPERDTPEILKEYASRFEYPEGKWRFLTGDPSVIKALLTEDFNFATAEDPSLHSTRIVLIDGARKIRGFYQGDDADGVSELTRAIARLVESERDTLK
jgi:protein SCO1/2